MWSTATSTVTKQEKLGVLLNHRFSPLFLKVTMALAVLGDLLGESMRVTSRCSTFSICLVDHLQRGHLALGPSR